jgi:apolipoprotein N-acyltransferase
MPDGTITQETKEFTAASLVSTMPLRSNLTLAARYGEWVTWTIALVGIVMAILGVGRRKSRADSRHD